MDGERGGNRARAPAGTQRGWERRCPGPLTRPGGEEDEAKVTEDAQPAQHITHHHQRPPPPPPSAPRFPSRLARSTTAFPSRAPQPKHDLSVHRCILPRGCCSPSPALRSHAYLRNSSFFPLSFELLSSPNGLKHLPNYPSCHPAAAPGRRRPVQARYCAS
jgi:hypothetical protein